MVPTPLAPGYPTVVEAAEVKSKVAPKPVATGRDAQATDADGSVERVATLYLPLAHGVHVGAAAEPV